MAVDGENKKCAFEEFSLYYESTEKVTDRRLSGNRWNYSICTAVLVAIAAVLQWAISHPSFFAVGAGIAIVVSGVAWLFCTLWIYQIMDFKELNNAKFRVLNEMAPRVAFGTPSEDDRSSYSPFQKEWEIMQERKSVQQVANTSIVALNSSNVEYYLPRTFRVLFLLFIILVVIASLLNWHVFLSSLSLHIDTNQ